MSVLELRGVSKEYGEGAAAVLALRGVDLAVGLLGDMSRGDKARLRRPFPVTARCHGGPQPVSVAGNSLPNVESRFAGWPDQAHAVLLQLEGAPSRETMDRVRRQREALVRQPMIDLLNDLADTDPWYEDFSVWRFGTTPFWWQHQCGIVRVTRSVEFGFQFSLDGLRVAIGWQYGDGEQIALFRAAVAASGSGCVLEDLVQSLVADGHEISGDMLKRVPRGYQAGHPRAELLRYRSLIAGCELEAETVSRVEPVYRACERLRPLADWLAEHLAE